MSSYVDPKTGKIIYTDGSSTPSEGVYPSSYTGGTSGATGATGGAVTPTASPTGTSGVLYTDGAAALPTDSYGYAEWLRNSAYQNATDAANKARQEALLNKQNALVGADTAYKQGLATYGANAESLASKGLSNSGYGEYLTGKNYASARAEKAAANATYQGAMNDILYQENSAKREADRLYTEQMIQLDEKKKTEAQSAYDSLLMSAQSGTDISALQSDARWALISPEQQNAITAASNEYNRSAADKFVVGAIESIRNGTMTLDEVKAMGGWATAGTEGQARIEAAATEVTRGKTFDEIIRNITAGDYDENSITSAPGWDTLTDAEKDQALDEIRLREDTVKGNYFKNSESIIAGMTPDNAGIYTDEYLQRMVDNEMLDADGVTAVKNRVKSIYESEINGIDISTDEGRNEYFDKVREAYNTGVIDEPTYHQYNFDAVLTTIDSDVINPGDLSIDEATITKMKNEGALSHKEAEDLIEYLYDKNLPRLSAFRAVKNSNGTIKIQATDGTVLTTSLKPVSLEGSLSAKLTKYKDEYEGMALRGNDGKVYCYVGGAWYALPVEFKYNLVIQKVEEAIAPKAGKSYANNRWRSVFEAESSGQYYDLYNKKTD